MTKSEILVPLLNANEPEARLVGVHVKDRQAVEKGALLFTIETTKAAADIEAPAAGFVRILAKEEDTLAVGDHLAVITETADESVEIPPRGDVYVAPAKMRITRPAQALAESLGVDLTKLPTDRLITEEAIRGLAEATLQAVSLPRSDRPYILIYGAGGHAKSILEMVQQLGAFSVAGIVDDDPALTRTQVLGTPVLGTQAALPTLAAAGVKLAANGVGGVLDIGVRVKVFERLKEADFGFPALVHPRATVEPSARVGEGVQVFANAYVGSETVLHPKCMVNTNAVVSHDCEIGRYTHIAPGALLAGHVHVGERTLIGMGVTATIGVTIGSGVRVGNGAIILADVPDKTIVQVGQQWPRRPE